MIRGEYGSACEMYRLRKYPRAGRERSPMVSRSILPTRIRWSPPSYVCSRLHSKWRVSAITGRSSMPGDQSTPSKRSTSLGRELHGEVLLVGGEDVDDEAVACDSKASKVFESLPTEKSAPAADRATATERVHGQTRRLHPSSSVVTTVTPVMNSPNPFRRSSGRIRSPRRLPSPSGADQGRGRFRSSHGRTMMPR
jgi:hypothetical protein